MIKFDEYEFKDWLDGRVGFSIRKHWVEGQDVDGDVQEAVDCLTPMDLTCYLGEYLTRENHKEGK